MRLPVLLLHPYTGVQWSWILLNVNPSYCNEAVFALTDAEMAVPGRRVPFADRRS